jgi:hypothetical protein
MEFPRIKTGEGKLISQRDSGRHVAGSGFVTVSFGPARIVVSNRDGHIRITFGGSYCLLADESVAFGQALSLATTIAREAERLLATARTADPR